MVRLVSLSLLMALIVFLGMTFYRVIAPFLLPLFLAGIVAVLSQPLFRYFQVRLKGRTHLAAGITTMSVIAIVLAPICLGTVFASLQLYHFAHQQLTSDNLQVVAGAVRVRVNDLLLWSQNVVPESVLPQQLPENWDDQIRAIVPQVLTNVSDRSLGIAGKTIHTTVELIGSLVSGLLGVLMFVVGLHYFLADGPSLLAATERLIPIHADYQRQLLQKFDKVVRAVVLATLLAAVGQGFATAGALYLVGLVVGSNPPTSPTKLVTESSTESSSDPEDNVTIDLGSAEPSGGILRQFFLMFIVSTLASLVPLAGTWMLWGPCVIYLIYYEYWVTAVMLTIFGTVVIGLLDNFIRTYVLHSDAKLHPLLAFVSVFGGLQAMGLWGVFVGPIVASCLHALVQIFNTELKEFSKERFSRFGTRRRSEGSRSQQPTNMDQQTIPDDPANEADVAALPANQPSPQPDSNDGLPEPPAPVDSRAGKRSKKQRKTSRPTKRKR